MLALSSICEPLTALNDVEWKAFDDACFAGVSGKFCVHGPVILLMAGEGSGCSAGDPGEDGAAKFCVNGPVISLMAGEGSGCPEDGADKFCVNGSVASLTADEGPGCSADGSSGDGRLGL